MPPEEAQSLVEQFNALASELDGEDGGVAPAEKPAKTAQKPAAEAKSAPAEKPAKEPTDGDDESKEREGKALPAERAQFRAEKRAFKAKAAEREAAIAKREQELAAEKAQLAAASLSPEKIRALDEAGDVDAIAKLAGYQGWNEMVAAQARRFASPEYKAVQELKAKQKAAEERAAKMEQEREERASAERGAEIQKAQVAAVQKTLAEWADRPDVVAASEDPAFAQAVTGIVAKNLAKYNHVTDEDVREEMTEAIDQVMESARKSYEALQKIFGDQSTAKTEAARAVTPNRAGSKQPASASKHVSKAKATEASAAPDLSDDRAWHEYAKRELSKSFAEDTALHR